MQPLARDGLSSDAVRALLTADSVEIAAGLDLLDSSNRFVEDISDDLAGGEVERSNYATVHGTCRLQVMRELIWGRDRVRPWMMLTSGKTYPIEETVVDREAATVSRVDDTDDEWNAGTLTDIEASGDALILAGAPGATHTVSFETVSSAASGNGYTLGHKGSFDMAVTLTAVVVKYHTTGSSTIRPVVYDSAGVKLAEGPEQTITVTSTSTYHTLPFAAGVALSAGATYLIGYRDTSGSTAGVGNGGGGGAHSHASSPAYTTWTDAGTGGLLYDLGDTYPTSTAAVEATMRFEVESPGTLATSGSRVSPTLSLSPLAAVDSSTVEWVATVPAGTTLTVETSVDNGATWDAASSGDPIQNVAPGVGVLTRLSLTGDGTSTPVVSSLSVSASQSQIAHTETTQAHLAAKFYAGVYVLTTPETKRGEDPATWDVTGFDLLHLLQDGPGDTYVIEADGVTTYLAAVQQIVTDSGVGATLRLDGTGGATLLERDFVWCLTDGGPTWLGMVNDLLSAINYRGIWANHDGELRSAPYAQPSVRPVEWTLDTADDSTNLVGEERTMTADAWAAPNWWRFVRRNMDAQPTIGAGIYEPAVNATDATSTALGRLRRKVVFLDAADQASLEAQGDRIVAEDTAVTRTFEIQVDPLPVAGHFDIVRLIDGGRSDKCQVSSWTLPLDGSPGRWTLEAVNG